MIATPAAASPLRDKAFSLYLDLWRAFAALIVVMAHMRQDGFDLPITFAGKFAHEAVIVFFVLSGLVIAHSTFDNNRGWRDYLAARASRLYAVIVPAILLSVACAAIVSPPGWSSGTVKSAEWSAWDIVSSLLFLNRSWLNDADIPLNQPFWSLCYEAAYYTLFGIWVFTKGKLRIGLMLLGMMVAGPAILLLSPAWLAGVWLYRNIDKTTLPARPLIAILSIAAIAVIGFAGVPPALRGWFSGNFPMWYVLRDATNLITDLLIGFLFTLHLVAVRTLIPPVLMRFSSAIRFLAGGTFTLYMFHRPITELLSGAAFAKLHGPLMSLLVLALIVCFALMMSRTLERGFTRFLRKWIEMLLERSTAMRRPA